MLCTFSRLEKQSLIIIEIPKSAAINFKAHAIAFPCGQGVSHIFQSGTKSRYIPSAKAIAPPRVGCVSVLQHIHPDILMNDDYDDGICTGSQRNYNYRATYGYLLGANASIYSGNHRFNYPNVFYIKY
jgi:hypothetical protein